MENASRNKGAWRRHLLGKLIALIVRSLGLFIRFKIEPEHGLSKINSPIIGVFWHEHYFASVLTKAKLNVRTPVCVLCSPSKDGDISHSILTNFGIKTVRGSSASGATRSLIALKKSIKNGDGVYFTPDGPRGPRHKIKHGVIKLAQISGAQIVTVNFSYSSSWKLSTWDRSRIPKPFSKVTVKIGELITVPEKLTQDAFNTFVDKVQNELLLDSE